MSSLCGTGMKSKTIPPFSNLRESSEVKSVFENGAINFLF